MRTLTLDAAMALYRDAADATASGAEGAAWWADDHEERHQVFAAPPTAQTALVIAWWHDHWSMVSDSPRSAAQRIRIAARAA
jgi:hypothetical protein